MIGDGKLLTNAHCVEHNTQVSFYTYTVYFCMTVSCQSSVELCCILFVDFTEEANVNLII